MGWAVWLSAPVGATTLAALWIWARGWAERRAARPLSTEAAMRAHQQYLDALAVSAAGDLRTVTQQEHLSSRGD